MTALLAVDQVSKSFTMHLQGGLRLPVVRNVTFDVEPGTCVVLGGASGVGKSSLLKMIYATYRVDCGRIWVHDGTSEVDVASAPAQRIIRLRRDVIGYVSQFLRVIPRVSALEVVAAAARDAGDCADAALARAEALLARLNLPRRLWHLAPATFSGGEQQRVNIARGFAGRHRILLLDEPTASLDAANSEVVTGLIAERKSCGAAIVGIFHDPDVRDRVADRVINVAHFAPTPISQPDTGP